jgi:hypothetical protein
MGLHSLLTGIALPLPLLHKAYHNIFYALGYGPYDRRKL